MTESADMTLLNLETIAGGALPELFQESLRDVLDNVADPNTKASAKRTITMTVTIEPSKERQSAAVRVGIRTKLAPLRDTGGSIYLGRLDGENVATVIDQRQLQLAWDERSKPRSISDTEAPAGESATAGA